MGASWVRGVEGGLRANLRVAAKRLARRHGWPAGVGRPLVARRVLVCVELPVLGIEEVQLARVAALARLTIGVAAVVHSGAVGGGPEVDVAAKRVQVSEGGLAVDRR